MIETTEFVNRYDRHIVASSVSVDAARQALEQLTALAETDKTVNEAAEEQRKKLEALFKRHADLLTQRQRDEDAQAAFARLHYRDAAFNVAHWRRIGWHDVYDAPVNPETFRVVTPRGAHVDVSRDRSRHAARGGKLERTQDRD